MGKQILYGNSLFLIAAKFRDIFGDWIRERQLTLLVKHHDRRRGRYHLCQRCQIKNCINRQLFPFGFQGTPAIGFEEERLSLMPKQNNSAGCFAGRDVRLHEVVDSMKIKRDGSDWIQCY